MHFELNGHTFRFDKPSLFLISWPNGQPTNRLIQGMPRNMAEAKRLASALLSAHEQNPLAYGLPINKNC